MPSLAAKAHHRQQARRAAIGCGCALVLALGGGLMNGASGASGASAAPTHRHGSLTGHVTAPSTAGSPSVPVAAITVTASAAGRHPERDDRRQRLL